LNLRSAKVRDELKKIIRFWLEEKKVNGLRIDAFKHLFKDPSFPDELPNKLSTKNHKDVSVFVIVLSLVIVELKGFFAKYDLLDHKYTTGLPETFEILAEWRQLADEIGKRTHSSK
jgi:glycosidase